MVKKFCIDFVGPKVGIAASTWLTLHLTNDIFGYQYNYRYFGMTSYHNVYNEKINNDKG